MKSIELAKLNQKYGIRDHLVFNKGSGGIVVAEIKNRHAEATVALHGGQILSFRPRAQAPVLWLSRKSYFQTGKAIRGGIPVCWPWFGDHPTDTDKPAHGFARTAAWSVDETEQLEDESTRLQLCLAASEETMALWPHPFRMAIEATVSDALGVKLIYTNTDHVFIFTISKILHAPRLLDPWVPDDGRTAAIFGDADAAMQTAVLNGARGRRVHIDAVGFTLNADGPRLHLPTPLIDFVDIGTVAQAFYHHV